MRAELTVDVIITNYNYGEYVGAAIESALAQSHPAVRVLVVDDGSDDDSPQVIAGYGDKISSIMQENAGQAAAFNAGAAATQGDLIIFLDADDLLLPEIAALAAAAYRTDPNASKIHWHLELATEDGAPTGVVRPPRHVPLPSGDMRQAELDHPFDNFASATSGNAFPRATLDRLLPMPELEFRTLADAYLQHLPPLLGPVIALESVGALRRVHGSNSYEQAPSESLDLDHIHATIAAAQSTARALELLADELGLPRPPGPLISVSDLTQRIVSLRLDPTAHPISADTRTSLFVDGLRAARRRSDVRAPMRLLFGAWFAAMAALPRPLAIPIAQRMLFPEQRPRINRILGLLHRRSDQRVGRA